MPHPKGRVKLSGDTHLPDLDDDIEPGTLTAVDEGSLTTATGGAAPGREDLEDDAGAASTDGSLALAARGPVDYHSPAGAQASWVKPVAIGLVGLWLVRRILR